MSYENLSKELKINIFSYLDYETLENVNILNKEHNKLYKEINENKYFEIYSTKEYYVNTKNINAKFSSLLFIKIIYYNNDIITYNYIKYGNYNEYKYPISNIFLYILSHDLTYPSHDRSITISKSEFNETYKIYKNRLFNNNKKKYIKFFFQSIMMYIFF